MSLGPFAALPMLGMAISGEGQPLSQTQANNQAAQSASSAVKQYSLGKTGNLNADIARGVANAAGFTLFGWDPVRVVTLALGLLLVAAGLFSHPAVREKIVKAGKVAAAAA